MNELEMYEKIEELAKRDKALGILYLSTNKDRKIKKMKRQNKLKGRTKS